jgi:hypothetical protein
VTTEKRNYKPVTHQLHPPYLIAVAITIPVLQSTPADAKRINVKSTNEVNYWCHTLNCTETRLRNAVLAVGPLTADVQAYLNR